MKAKKLADQNSKLKTPKLTAYLKTPHPKPLVFLRRFAAWDSDLVVSAIN